MTKHRRKRHKPEQIVSKLRDADAMLNAGKDLAVVLQTLEIAEVTYQQYGGMKSEEAKRLKQFEDENRRLKQIVADKEFDKLPAARSLTARFRQDYNECRPHSLLGCMTPRDFATQWPASAQSAALPSLQQATATAENKPVTQSGLS
jgi:putative transposase